MNAKYPVPVCRLAIAAFILISMVGPAHASVMPDFNHFNISVANDAGAKYDPFGDDTYYMDFEGIDRGLNALHVSTDPAVNFGQVTLTDSLSGTFYATDSGGKGYEDEILLLVAANGTIPDDFSLHITSDGYTWTPNPIRNTAPDLATVVYQPVALDETFMKADFIYGPQIWKPTGNEAVYPVIHGQDMADTANTFQILFIDLNAGVLRPNDALTNRGAVRIHYTIQNPGPVTAFSVYGYCRNPNNGDDMIAWTNALVEPKAVSGYAVRRPVLALPGQANPPTDPDSDGLYEDLSGNGATSFTDVVLFFRNMDWIAVHEPVAAFDFSQNGAIAFKDIELLFREV